MLNLNNARVKPPTLHSFTIELLIAVLLLQVILVCSFDFHLFVRSVSAPSDFCFVLAYHVFFFTNVIASVWHCCNFVAKRETTCECCPY